MCVCVVCLPELDLRVNTFVQLCDYVLKCVCVVFVQKYFRTLPD